MSSELRELYQEVILDHGRRPRNFHKLAAPAKHSIGYNPLCGDQLTVYIDVDENDRVREVSFQGSGCAISTASASVMTETLRGKSRAEVQELFDSFHALVTGTAAGDPAELGKLAIFAGVSEFPTRVKCATLAWHTARAAMEGQQEVSTE